MSKPSHSLDRFIDVASSEKLPPVHLWNPPYCGEIDIRIARDGTWFYQDSPIGRRRLVKLFSSILKKEGDGFFLVTPVEKVKIQVEDAPFVAQDVERSEQSGQQILLFTTHVGDKLIAGPKHQLRFTFDPKTDEPAPYIMVRDQLEALIDRKSFYRLVDIAEQTTISGQDWLGLSSSGVFFPMIEAHKLP